MIKKSLKKFFKKFLSPKSILKFHKFKTIFLNIRYGFPGRKLIPIGITGTKGKTTTAFLISSILEEAGYKIGRLSTVDFKIGDQVVVNEENMTVVSPEKMLVWLKKMVEEKCRFLIMEVTSHSIDQNRVWGIPYKIAVLTNVTHDHLDYHKTFANYREVKTRLFRWPSIETAVINADDRSADYFSKKTTARKKIFYKINDFSEPGDKNSEVITAQKVFLNPTTSRFILASETERIEVNLNLPGRFNIENALAAASVAISLNIRLGTIKAGLEKVTQVPGRMERIETNKGFTVIIDYAHTPDSLEKVYQTLRPLVRGRLISVLGACGDRDKTKRPIMGALAGRFADLVLITDEEPYTEKPIEIIEALACGVPRGRPLFQGKKQIKKRKPLEHKIHDVKEFLKQNESTGEGNWWWKVLDRREAINKALHLAKFDDVVLITGMGAQTRRVVGEKHLPWNDREVVEEELSRL